MAFKKFGGYWTNNNTSLDQNEYSHCERTLTRTHTMKKNYAIHGLAAAITDEVAAAAANGPDSNNNENPIFFAH